ncbi:MAG: hypothetical protein PF489_12815 [Salinivirgaceae bacterium]|jgi:hypothetical protein|nr:hypothetical protein [Salinivirgaceae bacterium]
MEAIKERPILFSTPMVQAILAGQKTQTRRICKHQNWSFSEISDVNNNGITQKTDRDVSCRYGQVGDLLWVRETWMQNPNKEYFPEEPIYYKASKSKQFIEEFPTSWKPSIHMHKINSRIWLKITDIRVERIQRISDEDAILEGIEKYGPFDEYKGSLHPGGGMMRYRAYSNPSRAFQDLWENINGNDSWKENPWVWVIKFEVISTTGKPKEL